MDVVWLLLRAIVALAAVLGLIWWGARRMSHRRVQRSGFEPHVQVVDRHSLTRGSGVAVLAIGNRRLLVGFGEQQVGLLTELAPVVAPLEPAGTDLVPAQRGQHDKTDKKPADGEHRSPLAGSVLHPQTWKDTLRALQDRTVRR